LSKRAPDGASEKAHLEQVKRQTGTNPEELAGPRFPVLMEDIWSAFKCLSYRRSPSVSGVQPITYEQILAFKNLTDTPISPREIKVLEALDNRYVRAMNE
jgi:hypothetical protein